MPSPRNCEQAPTWLNHWDTPRSHGRHKLGGQVLDLSHLLQQDQLGHNCHTLQPNGGGPEYLHTARDANVFCGLESLKRLEVLLQARARLCLMHDFSHVGSFVKQSQMSKCADQICDEATTPLKGLNWVPKIISTAAHPKSSQPGLRGCHKFPQKRTTLNVDRIPNWHLSYRIFFRTKDAQQEARPQ